MTDASVSETVIATPQEAGFGDFVSLMKPRVMTLVVFTAAVGLLVAPVHVHPFVALVSILFIAIGGGASGALNMWYEADIDTIMRRTRGRPIPSGRVAPGEALGFGLALSGFSVLMLGLAANWVGGGGAGLHDLFLCGHLHDGAEAADAAEHRHRRVPPGHSRR